MPTCNWTIFKCSLHSSVSSKSKKIGNIYWFNILEEVNRCYCCKQRQRIPKWQTGNIRVHKTKTNKTKTQLATSGTQDEDKQNKNTTQYVLDTTICAGHHNMQTNTNSVKRHEQHLRNRLKHVSVNNWNYNFGYYQSVIISIAISIKSIICHICYMSYL